MFDPKSFKKSKTYNPHLSRTTIINDKFTNFVTLTLDNMSEIYVDPYDFVGFIIKNKIAIQDNTIVFPLIQDYEGELHTEIEYNKWLSKNESNLEKSIDFDDLIPGNTYKLDNGTKFLFLGKKFIINYRITQDGKFSVVKKGQFKYICYQISDNNDLSFDLKRFLNGNIFYLSNKVLVTKDCQKNASNKINFMLKKFIHINNVLYCEDTVPPFSSFKVKLKEISIKEISDLYKTLDINHIDCFHKLKSGNLIYHNMYISKDFLNDQDYSRQINDVNVYDRNFNLINKRYVNSRTSLDKDDDLFELEKCNDNNSYRLCPTQYFVLDLVGE